MDTASDWLKGVYESTADRGVTAVSDRAVLGVVVVSDRAPGSGRRLPGALTADREESHQQRAPW